MRIPRPALLGSLALAAACASASISSIAAPESAGHSYHRVLVIAPFGDIGMRRFVEESFEAWSNDSGTRFTAAYRLLFPGRSYTATEVTQILRTNNIDATLLLEPQSSGFSSSYVPPTYKLTCTQWMSGTGCASAPIGGGTVEKPWATFSARLFDAGSGAVAWIATGDGGGSAFTGMSSVYRAIADRTVKQLAVDHLAFPRMNTAADSAATARAAAQDQESRSALGRP